MIDENNNNEQKGFVKSLEVPLIEEKIGLFQVAMEILLLITIVQFLVILFTTTRLHSGLELSKLEIAQLEEKLKNPQLVQIKDQVENIGSRIKLLESILAKSEDYSDFWEEIEQTLVSGSGYTSITIDKDKTVVLSGKTINYEVLAKLISSLKSSKKFTDINLIQSSSDEKIKSFSLTMKYIKEEVKKSQNEPSKKE
ncbi:hypothetical protein COZ61_02035 [Candidatus Berkelbacteria bacterium CG_4_8_14_3_um_filter_33_6]|uniref:Fimbrial assembly protein n=1 Tax=Candidatus Berkelbacteria bacterium CG_4_10_14_0_2_um_filter_35_9_33_12 TaxID=1974499 RepID=A0A2M7W433_9BACT|nr:MAG: hypothetical protein COX10_00505 [Candidatus Berkelbacteria bacterium CG23_combo_of_CG06-09_8_20_14_all_33_15]PIS08334.1 MAG: hypothetical protein COT76_01950 [Candidatus Berkelbacteria bacterium CG10_big_fil_rev_8_21_14_0_10_33_10]PIX31010.1 MAG: hypothetical protein COZ61_02035 [Candidatus Berkelbacteria bacterium CG_4_8_14_3_um_filter_33_6]PIZ28192.1 MAG: hypothetical protein COY43_01795 [Candidatus Berkelbacteria bacterium CG_4_10_14_0_8_um_filter_35_9_33_8]PJA20442.1 MAG: hypotheti